MKNKILNCIKVAIMTIAMALGVYVILIMEATFVVFEAPISIIILSIAGSFIIWIYLFTVLYELLFEQVEE